jgi:hypothetical protein
MTTSCHILSISLFTIIQSFDESPKLSRYNDWSEFESRYGQEFSLLLVVQTGSGAHSASYPMDTNGSFPGGKAAGP